MSTTFATDSGSAVQAEGLTVEEDSRLHIRLPDTNRSRRRYRGTGLLRKNPNTPFPGRRLQAFPVPAGDKQVEARCREALRWITTLPEGSVTVHAELGRVTLEGTVAHANEREVAADAIRQVDGVTEVDNRIEVR